MQQAPAPLPSDLRMACRQVERRAHRCTVVWRTRARRHNAQRSERAAADAHRHRHQPAVGAVGFCGGHNGTARAQVYRYAAARLSLRGRERARHSRHALSRVTCSVAGALQRWVCHAADCD